MKALLSLILSGAAGLAQTPPPAAPKTPTAAPKTQASPAKTAPAVPRPNPLLNPAGLKAIAPPLFQVKFSTTHGDFVVEVHRDWAPLGADRFYNLVRNRFFTNAAFFRVVPNFVVQFGLPADPAITKAWVNAAIKDDPVTQSNKRGNVVFATAGPGTRTTQLFINLRDNGPLDGQGFAPFGTVIEGMDIVDGIYSGYGQTPDQTRITNEGKAYLDKNFPKIDSIKSAVVVAPAPPTGAPKKAPSPSPTAPKTASAAPAPNPLLLNPAALKAIAPALFHVKFSTTHGDFVVEVHRDWAPLGADRFYNLVRNRFFTNAAFFRVVPNFVVQFGLPADPAVTKAWQTAVIKDDPVTQSNKRGNVVFATAGPNTRTTQLFINLRDNGPLDASGFAPFGTVTEGMDIVDGIYAGYGEAPQQPLITSQGKTYLDANFPRLDSIKSAVVVPAAPPAPATKSAAPTPAPATKKQ
jgi:peptidyl-prolyl cis-trans isomerase A (cyclophilin A)